MRTVSKEIHKAVPEELVRFTSALFRPDDFVAIRPIETWTEKDKQKEVPVKRSRVIWQAERSVRAAQLHCGNDWHVLGRLAERTRANLFFGVCPRFGPGNHYNLAWQIRTVLALWADLDHCLPTEAKQRCLAARLPEPSLIVASGHGAHVYWLLDTPYLIDDAPPPPPVYKAFIVQANGKKIARRFFRSESGEKIYEMPPISPLGARVQRTLAGIAEAVGGDHTIDLSRLLRLPGTLNRKDERNGKEPIPCQLAEWDPGRRYPFETFIAFAESQSVQAKWQATGKSSTNWTPPPEGHLSAEDAAVVKRLVGQHSKFRLLWKGDRSGYRSASHADWAAACILARCSLNIDRILTILWRSGLRREKWGQRPDYLEETVAKAMDHVAQKYVARMSDSPAPMPREAAPPVGVDSGGSTALEPRPLDEVHLTEWGNAQRLVRGHGQDLRYCHPWKQWLVWDGRHWREDDTGEPERRMKATIATLYRWAADRLAELGADDPTDQDSDRAIQEQQVRAVQSHCLRSETAKGLRASLSLAQSEPGIPIVHDQMNRDPWLLNVRNGTLDLCTGRLRPHDRQDHLTKIAPVSFAPEACCPIWMQFIDSIFAGNAHLIEYLQRLLGYALTGVVRENLLVVLWGDGANGKSTLVNTFLELLGPGYGFKAPRDLFVSRKSDNHPTLLASLFGKRFVVGMETQDGSRLDEAMVKEMTGNDPLTARKMRQDYWTFLPTHKAFIATNYRPEVRGTDHGIWRRLRLVPFRVRFWNPDDPAQATAGLPDNLRQDKQLSARLLRELPGILNWCLQGCLAWQSQGFNTPEEVIAATEEFKAEQDMLEAFLAECCHTGQADLRVRASALHARYLEWCKRLGEKNPLSMRSFGTAITAKGYEKKQSNGIWYQGIRLKFEEEDHFDPNTEGTEG